MKIDFDTRKLENEIDLDLSKTLKEKYNHKMGNCYSNVFQLWCEREIDEYHIGYVYCYGFNGFEWFRHAWGIKNGKIVDTTWANAETGNDYYPLIKFTNEKEVCEAMQETTGPAMLEYDICGELEFLYEHEDNMGCFPGDYMCLEEVINTTNNKLLPLYKENEAVFNYVE